MIPPGRLVGPPRRGEEPSVVLHLLDGRRSPALTPSQAAAVGDLARAIAALPETEPGPAEHRHR